MNDNEPEDFSEELRWRECRASLRAYEVAGALHRALSHFETAMALLCLDCAPRPVTCRTPLTDAEWGLVRRGLSEKPTIGGR